MATPVDKPQCPTCGSGEPNTMVKRGPNAQTAYCPDKFHGGQAGPMPCPECKGSGLTPIETTGKLHYEGGRGLIYSAGACPDCKGTGVQTPKTSAHPNAEVSSLPKLAEPDTTSITPPTSHVSKSTHVPTDMGNSTADSPTSFVAEVTRLLLQYDAYDHGRPLAAIIEAVEKHVIGEDDDMSEMEEYTSNGEIDSGWAEATAWNQLRKWQRRHLHE